MSNSRPASLAFYKSIVKKGISSLLDKSGSICKIYFRFVKGKSCLTNGGVTERINEEHTIDFVLKGFS